MTAPTFEQAVNELMRVGALFYERSWVPATSGNFSVRLDDGSIAITVSGRHKGALRAEDLMRVSGDGEVLTAGKKPSAETALHTQLYRRDACIGAVLHHHSRTATLMSKLVGREIVVSDYEVLKAFTHYDTHEARARLPVFANDQDVPRLAAKVDAWLDSEPDPIGYLIEGHGLYTWGETVADARRHVEALEFLLGCELELLRLQRVGR